MSKDAIELTYLINRLQNTPLGVPPVLETLNARHTPDPSKVLAELVFDHPLFDEGAIAAQHRLPTIQGRGGVWYAGAWTRYGFHEDGLLSAVRVAEALGAHLPWGDELDETRTRPLEGHVLPGERA
ncbi:MAG: hypothetical protein Q7W30_00845 [Coriobacteriia bacterium]|nr:hypothetical protein [Coriobacteriia bacterium]